MASEAGGTLGLAQSGHGKADASGGRVRPDRGKDEKGSFYLSAPALPGLCFRAMRMFLILVGLSVLWALIVVAVLVLLIGLDIPLGSHVLRHD